MSYNDIFNDYVRLMIKEAEKSSKEVLEETGRVDSRSIKEIEKLYNVKNEDDDYEKNIIEKAHPKPVVIAPAHDKINGLVENENERQNISINIINKKPTFANPFHKKYAETKKDLALSLVRVGNFLDAKGEEQLVSLADACLKQLSEDKKKLKKEALAPLAIAGIAATAAAITGIAVMQNSNMKDIGFEQNLVRLKKEIVDLQEKEGGWGTTKLKGSFKQSMSEVQSHLDALLEVYKKFESAIYGISKPKDYDELMALAKSQKSQADQMTSAYKEFVKVYKQVVPMVNSMEENFKSSTYKEMQVEDRGILSQVGDVLNIGEIFHGRNALVSDDFNDVVRAIPPFKESANYIKSILIKASQSADDVKRKLEEAQAEAESSEIPSDLTSDTGSSKKPGNSVKSDEKSSEEAEIESQLGVK